MDPLEPGDRTTQGRVTPPAHGPGARGGVPDDTPCRAAARPIGQNPGLTEAAPPEEDGPRGRGGPAPPEEDGPRGRGGPGREGPGERAEVVPEKERSSAGPRARGAAGGSAPLPARGAAAGGSAPLPARGAAAGGSAPLPARGETALGTEATQTTGGGININTMKNDGARAEAGPGAADGSSRAETNKLTHPETELPVKEDTTTTAPHKSRQPRLCRGPCGDFICLGNSPGPARALSSETCRRWPAAEHQRPGLNMVRSVAGVAVDERLQKVNIHLLLPGLDTDPPNGNTGRDSPQPDYSRKKKKKKRKRRCISLLEKRDLRGQLSTEAEEPSARGTGTDPRSSRSHSGVRGGEEPISGSLPSNPDGLAFSSASISHRQCNALHCPRAKTISHQAFCTHRLADDNHAPTPAACADVATRLQAEGPPLQTTSTGWTPTPGSLTLKSVCESSFLSGDERGADHGGTPQQPHEENPSLAARSCISSGAAKANPSGNSVSHGGESNASTMEAAQSDEESTDSSNYEQNIADMSDNAPQVLDTNKRDKETINEAERREASEYPSELKGPIEGPVGTTSETGGDVSDAPDSKNKVFAMSSFWNEMERLTINDILGLRMISVSPPPPSLSPLPESEEADVNDTADSGYFTPQLDEATTRSTVTDSEQATVNSAASRHDSLGSLDVLWDGERLPGMSGAGINPEDTVLTSDTNPRPQLSAGSEERHGRPMLKNTSVYNLHATNAEQFGRMRNVPTLAAVLPEESESERECLSDVQRPRGDGGTDSTSSSLFSEGTPAESYRISLPAILKCLFGGKQSNPKPPDSEDTGIDCGRTVPETYHQFFSEFDCGSFFDPFDRTEDRPTDRPVPVLSRSRSSSRYLQYPEAFDHFLSSPSSSSSSSDGSSESEEDPGDGWGPVRVVTRLSPRTASEPPEASTDIYENFFTDTDLPQSLFWSPTFSLRNVRLSGPVSRTPQSCGPLTPGDQGSVRRRRRVFSSIDALDHRDRRVPEPELDHCEERVPEPELDPFEERVPEPELDPFEERVPEPELDPCEERVPEPELDPFEERVPEPELDPCEERVPEPELDPFEERVPEPELDHCEERVPEPELDHCEERVPEPELDPFEERVPEPELDPFEERVPEPELDHCEERVPEPELDHFEERVPEPELDPFEERVPEPELDPFEERVPEPELDPFEERVPEPELDHCEERVPEPELDPFEERVPEPELDHCEERVHRQQDPFSFDDLQSAASHPPLSLVPLRQAVPCPTAPGGSLVPLRQAVPCPAALSLVPLRQAVPCPTAPGGSLVPLRQAVPCPAALSLVPLRQAVPCPAAPGGSLVPLRQAVPCPTAPGVSLVPLRHSDMCLVCIALASWVLKSADPHVGDAWKAVVLANVSALSAIGYLRRRTRERSRNQAAGGRPPLEGPSGEVHL
ncbi:unnamed protein product [Boreogadus saida]